MKNRRRLLQALGAGLVLPYAPLPARAQEGRQMSVIVLYAGELEDDDRATQPFYIQMRHLGWTEGKNIAYERLHGRGVKAYVESLARSAAGRTPDLVFATTASLAALVAKESDTVPIVFTAASDPVASGLVATMDKPGKNVTGVFQTVGQTVQHRFELIRETFPTLKRLGVVFDRNAVSYALQKQLHHEAGARTGFDLQWVEFNNYEKVLKILAQFRRDGVLTVAMSPSFTLLSRRRDVGLAARRNSIALIGHRVEWIDAGAILTYGAQIAEALQLCAGQADRILRGAKPGELAIEEAKKLELGVNQRVAHSLGVSVPLSVIKRADIVIN